MQSVWSSLIAVAGTLAGSILTHLFGRWNAQRAERVAHEERLREERTAMALAFGESVTELRRAAYDRWHRKRDDSDADVVMDTANEYYRWRASAEHALLKVKMYIKDPELIRAGRDALDKTTAINSADSSEELRAVGNDAQLAIDNFVAAAYNACSS